MHEPGLALGLPLQTSRVTVRPLRPSDLAQFCRYRADPVVGRYQSWSPMSEERSLDFLREMSTAGALVPDKWIQLAIASRETDLLIGDIGLFLDRDAESAEIGFTLARESQGRGLASEAVALVVESVFASSRVVKVRGVTDARNAASIRLLERVGFGKVSEHQATFNGEVCTEYVFERVRDRIR